MKPWLQHTVATLLVVAVTALFFAALVVTVRHIVERMP